MATYQVPVISQFVWQPNVKDKDLTAPPGVVLKGDRYIVGASATGAWVGEDGNIAQYNGSTYDFIDKKEGMITYVEDEGVLYVYIASWGKLGLDEDDMASNSATKLATQQSIKAYADTKIANVVEDLTPQLGGDLDLNGNNIDFPSTPNISDVKDEDDMASNSAVMLATQQSIKAFIENQNLVNLVKNGSFESWSAGTANQAPDGWSMIGTPTDVSRDTGDRDNFGNPYAAKITSNGAGNEGLTVTFSNLKASKKYIVICRAKATSADTAKIWTTGGGANLSETTTSTSWVTLSGTFTTDATPTNIVLKIGSDTATDIVWFDAIIVLEGEAIKQFSPHPNDQHLKAIDYQDNAPANFDYGLLRMECGYASVTSGAGPDLYVAGTVTFGTAFTKILSIVLTQFVVASEKEHTNLTTAGGGVSTTQLVYHVAHGDGSNITAVTTFNIHWIAIGVG